MDWRRLVFSLVLLVILCSAAFAKLPTGVVTDMVPLVGVVLLERGGEVLLDLTAEKGVGIGDLFSVVSRGKVVRHPQTGEILGTLDELVGLLELVQLRPGFSIARRLTGESLQPGVEIRRFDRISAQFYDSSVVGEGLFTELREALPHLAWQAYARIDAIGLAGLRDKKPSHHGLSFFYNGQILEVRGAEYALLHRYEVSQEPEPGTAAIGTTLKGSPLPSALASTTTETARPLTAKWLGAGAKGLPVGLAAADFDADGRVEIARAFEGRLEIGRLVGGDFTRLATHVFRAGQTVIALAALDLNRNGRTELFVTTVVEDEVRSEVLEFNDGTYKVIADGQPWFLSTLELRARGTVLLGQKRDRSHSGFSAEIHQLKWQKGALREAEKFTLPEHGMLYSLASMPQAGKNRFARINPEGRLEVFSGGEEALWVSDERGYSETGFLQADAQNPHWDAEFLHKVFLPPSLIAGPESTVITAMNTGRTGSDKYRQMRSLTLTGWQWQNQELQARWQMVEMDGYVPAMCVADADNDGIDELVVLIAHPNSGFFSVRKSVIKLFELK